MSTTSRTWSERDLVPLDPSGLVNEFSRPVEGLECLNTPAGVVWKRPVDAAATVADGSDGVEIDGPAPAFGSRPEDIASSHGHVSSIVALLDSNLRSSLGIDAATDSQADGSSHELDRWYRW